VWAAIDVDRKEIVSVWVSAGRSGFNAYLFLKDVLGKCENKPIFIVDKGPWYHWAFQRLGLEYKHETFGERNAIESWFSPFKQRTKRFWNRFPHGSTLRSIDKWLRAFSANHNLWLGAG
jgi:transposase-like protein